MTPGARRFAATTVPPAMRGRWIAVRTAPVPGLAAAFVEPLDEAGRLLAEPVAAWRWPGGGLAAVLFAGTEVAALGLVGMGVGFGDDAAPAATPPPPPLLLRPIGPWHAAIRLFVRRPSALANVFGGGGLGSDLRRPGAFKARVRAAQAALLAPHGRKLPYRRWVALFGPERGTDATLRAGVATAVAIRGAIVFAAGGASGAGGGALAATRATLARAGVPVRLVNRTDPDWRRAAAAFGVGGDDGNGDDGEDDDGAGVPGGSGSIGYVALLAAGEVVPGTLRAVAERALGASDAPALAFADTDRVDRNGRRSMPEFRGEPDHALMLSGTTARGVWFVRADVLAQHAARSAAAGAIPAAWAEVLRLELWCDRRERGSDDEVARLPLLLSSRRDDAEAAPPAALARVVDDHLRRSGIALRAAPGAFPVRLAPSADAPRPSVTLIVPSTLVAPHSVRCIEAVLAGTHWPALETIVAVGGPGAAGNGDADADGVDPVAAIAAALVRRHERVRVRRYPAAGFNFAWTVNRALADAHGDLVLLLNDDVRPIEPDWLLRMSAWLTDPRVGAVGARLLYPDGTVQHAGVVMGGEDVCAHAFRGLPGDAPGHGGRALLPGRWSALTGACLLLRAADLRALGGMDEHYPSAFNDIDLCLRLGERGASVVLSDAALIHEELQTFGSHWGRLGPALQRSAAERMRARWGTAIDADPWFSPNLDLGATADWREAWPPRPALQVSSA